MSGPFQPGDVVKCVDGKGTALMEGNNYTVIKGNAAYTQVVGGGASGWCNNRFVLAKAEPEKPQRPEALEWLKDALEEIEEPFSRTSYDQGVYDTIATMLRDVYGLRPETLTTVEFVPIEE